MTVTLSPDGQTFTMRGRSGWCWTLPLARLPEQVAFYRRLWSRGASVKGQPGPWARFHAPAVSALEAAQALAGKAGSA